MLIRILSSILLLAALPAWPVRRALEEVADRVLDREV